MFKEKVDWWPQDDLYINWVDQITKGWKLVMLGYPKGESKHTAGIAVLKLVSVRSHSNEAQSTRELFE